MNGTLLLVLLGLAWVLGYVLACSFWPFRACGAKRCEGGKVRSPGRKAYRRCRRCGGKGAKVRLGRKVFDLVTGREKLKL